MTTEIDWALHDDQRMREQGFTFIEDSIDSPALVSSGGKVAFKNGVNKYSQWGFMVATYNVHKGQWVTVCLTTEGAIKLTTAMLDSLLVRVS